MAKNALLEAPSGIAHESVQASALFETLYSELHRLARREVSRRGSFTGLGATTVLHEAYLTMSGKAATDFVDQARFIGYAARAMRGLIIDDVRRRRAQKRGGLFHLTSLGSEAESVVDPHTLQQVGDALEELAKVDADLAEIVELKFFCGFSFSEIAAMRGVSERTIQRSWEKGRLFLHHAITARRAVA